MRQSLPKEAHKDHGCFAITVGLLIQFAMLLSERVCTNNTHGEHGNLYRELTIEYLPRPGVDHISLVWLSCGLLILVLHASASTCMTPSFVLVWV